MSAPTPFTRLIFRSRAKNIYWLIVLELPRYRRVTKVCFPKLIIVVCGRAEKTLRTSPLVHCAHFPADSQPSRPQFLRSTPQHMNAPCSYFFSPKSSLGAEVPFFCARTCNSWAGFSPRVYDELSPLFLPRER